MALNSLPTAPKKSARISPDRPGVGFLSIIFVMSVMLASMIFSFEALRDAAKWTGAPSWARVLAPIYIDGSIIAYTVALAVFRWRQEDRYAKSALWWLRMYTFGSMIINGLHTAGFHDWDFWRVETWVGVVIAAGAPLSALVAAEKLIRLVFQQDPNDALRSNDETSPSSQNDHGAGQIEVSPSEDVSSRHPDITERNAPALTGPERQDQASTGDMSFIEAKNPYASLPGLGELPGPLLEVDEHGLFRVPGGES